MSGIRYVDMSVEQKESVLNQCKDWLVAALGNAPFALVVASVQGPSVVSNHSTDICRYLLDSMLLSMASDRDPDEYAWLKLATEARELWARENKP